MRRPGVRIPPRPPHSKGLATYFESRRSSFFRLNRVPESEVIEAVHLILRVPRWPRGAPQKFRSSWPFFSPDMGWSEATVVVRGSHPELCLPPFGDGGDNEARNVPNCVHISSPGFLANFLANGFLSEGTASGESENHRKDEPDHWKKAHPDAQRVTESF